MGTQQKSTLKQMKIVAFYTIFVLLQNIHVFAQKADVQENEVGCVTTCCMSCRGDFCDVCNKLNKYDPDRCPCLEDLAEEDLRKLFTRLEERDLVSKIRPLVKDMKMKDDMIEDDCKPACCPTLRCTPLLCPICYRRNKINKEACPCIKF